MFFFPVIEERDRHKQISGKSCPEKVRVVKSMGVDEETIEGVVDDEVFCLIRFHTFLPTQAYPTGLAFGGITIMLNIEVEFDILERS
jgi:hypothetical protein